MMMMMFFVMGDMMDGWIEHQDDDLGDGMMMMVLMTHLLNFYVFFTLSWILSHQKSSNTDWMSAFIWNSYL